MVPCDRMWVSVCAQSTPQSHKVANQSLYTIFDLASWLSFFSHDVVGLSTGTTRINCTFAKWMSSWIYIGYTFTLTRIGKRKDFSATLIFFYVISILSNQESKKGNCHILIWVFHAWKVAKRPKNKTSESLKLLKELFFTFSNLA